MLNKPFPAIYHTTGSNPIPEEDKLNPQAVLSLVKESWRALEYVEDDLQRSNTEIVFEAVAQHWMALKYAAAELKSDRVRNKAV